MISIKKIFYEKKSTKIILNVVSALAGETDDIKTDDDDVIDSHACMVLRRSLNAFYNNKQVTLEMKFKKKKLSMPCGVYIIYLHTTFFGLASP